MRLPITTRALIVVEPSLQSRAQRATGVVLTLVLWGLWAWLCWPALHAIGCAAVGAQCSDALPRFVELRRDELLLIAALTVAFTGALLAWATIQRRRFRSRTRRRPRAPVVVEELARRHRLDPQALAKWQRARRLVVHYNDDGTVRRIESADAAEAGVSAGAATAASPSAPRPPARRSRREAASASAPGDRTEVR